MGNCSSSLGIYGLFQTICCSRRKKMRYDESDKPLADLGLIEIEGGFEHIDTSKCFLDLDEDLENNITDVDLSGRNLTVIPDEISKYYNLQNLNASRNKLNSEYNFNIFTRLCTLNLLLNDYNFPPLLPLNLVKLNLGFNYLTYLKLRLECLEELRLDGNHIKKISKNCYFPKLKLLNLSLNGMYRIPNLSKITPALKSLILSDNHISEFPSDLPLTIKEIFLSNNSIEGKLENIAKYEQLEVLVLANNLLTHVIGLPASIKKIDLTNNLLSFLSTVQPIGLVDIKIYLNRLSYIPSNLFCNTSVLNMSRNFLDTLNINDFTPSITSLCLSSNLLREIPEEVFHLPKLSYLDITNNRLKKIPENIYESSIKHLLISENEISELVSLPKKLETLIAIKNDFVSLPIVVYNSSVLKMDFSNNLISGTIENLPSVRDISLSSNFIERIASIPNDVYFLDLSCNLLNEMFVSDINLRKLILANNMLSNLVFVNPRELRELNISNNPLPHFICDLSRFHPSLSLDLIHTGAIISKHVPEPLQQLLVSGKKPKNLNHPNARRVNAEHFGYSYTIGERITMEDTIIAYKFDPKTSVYGVIDGHGGAEVAKYAAKRIPELYMTYKQVSIGSFSEVCRQLNKEFVQNNITGGATIALAIVSPHSIGCANLGDTRAVIFSKSGDVISMTYDHKPSVPSELVNVKEELAFVVNNRIEDKLAISRALGDFDITGVTRIPSVFTHTLTSNDYRLVIASDGVFDVLNNGEISDVLMSEKDIHRAAVLIKNLSVSRVSTDNITVMVIDLTEFYNIS